MKSFPENKDHYVRLVRDLLRHIRDDSTQKEMDQKLGTTIGTWHKYESGYKHLKWNEFVHLCRSLELPLETSLKKITTYPSQDFTNGNKILNALCTQYYLNSVEEFAKGMKITNSKARRLLLEDQEVDLSIIFEFVGIFTQQLTIFIEALTGGWVSDDLSQIAQEIEHQKQLEGKFGWYCALEALLTLKSYRELHSHDDGWLATKLNRPEQEIRRALENLVRNNSVELQDGKYILNRGRVDMESSIEDSAKLAKFWTQKALERFETSDGVPSSRKGWAYRILPLSKTAQEELRQEIFKLAGKLHKIVYEDRDREKDDVHVLMVHNFNIDEFEQ